MARLEFEFLGIDKGLGSNIKTYLQDIDKLKQAFKGVGTNLNTTDVKAVLDGQKVALGQVRLETAELTKATKEYALEQRKLKDSGNTSQGGVYSSLSRELTQMRNEAKNLGAQMILLENAGMKTGVTYNTLSNRFEEAKKQVVNLDNQVKKLDGSLGQYNRHVGNYERSQGNANGVAMEFNRIIQDAPFGMMGIGNNIQQLTANWGQYVQSTRQAAAETGKTVSTMSLVRGAMSSIISPVNLLSLGIAAITSGWTAYTMWSQKAKKADEEKAKSQKSLKDGLDEYANGLNSVNSAFLKGEQNGQNELVRLNVLKKVYNDSNVSLKNRKNAYSEIISMYESYFGKLASEERKIINLENVYNKLADAIYKTAKATAYQEEIIANEKKLRVLNKKTEDSVKAMNNAKQKQNDEQVTLIDALVGKYGEEAKALANIEVIQKLSISGQQTQFKNQSKINALTLDWSKNLDAVYAVERDNEDLMKRITSIYREGAIIKGNEVGAIKNTNSGLNQTIEKIKTLAELLEELRSKSGISEKDFALEGKVGIDREIADLGFDYNKVIAEIKAFQDSVIKDTKISEDKRKAVIEESNRAIEVLMGRTLANIQTIQSDYSKRLEGMTVKAVDTSSSMGLFEDNVVKPREWEELNKRLMSDIKREITSILNMLPNLSGGFTEIFGQLTGGINEILKKSLIDDLGKMLTNKMQELDDSTRQIAGALAIAGQTLQGMFSKTNVVGQGLGGGLSGAASGLGIGTMLKDTLGKNGGLIGAGIGAVIGIVGGIFGAKRRKKEEELQRQQLEEQKKANALLERMNALAYASQIIGSKTQYGIVTGVNRNEFGEITFRVQGQDLVASVDRTRNNNSR